MSSESFPLLTGLAPVIRADVQRLILGSFLGAASLAAAQYYAHPRNQFWRLLSAVLNEDLVALPYAARVERLTTSQIGLWNVIAACEREGSLDAAIRRPQAVDFSHLRDAYPALRKIIFNGKTAGKYAPYFAEAGFGTLVLPSSSPANAQLSFEQKLVQWRALTD
jgi:hypoxanthine-DNA glycosylase